MVSDIGRPVDDPRVVDIELTGELSRDSRAVHSQLWALARGELSALGALRSDLLAERLAVY
jgi:S-adenosylmethionine synthetase